MSLVDGHGRGGGVPLLEVFVERGCEACRRAIELAELAQRRFPTVSVVVVNIADQTHEQPEQVFAVPTFLLDGQILSLGNPRPAELMRALAARIAARAP
jgi:thiol-disulfide isomerase/thioredoxin